MAWSDTGTAQARRMVAVAHAAGRLGHSWLITGEAGIGKLDFALWLVRLRWCEADAGDCAGGDAGNGSGDGAGGDARGTGGTGGTGRDAGAVERPCGACRSCRMVDSGNHPDLVVVSRDPPPDADPQGLGSKHEITVGQVREMILSGLSLRAVEGRGRVVIVDGADDLNEEAQNALLKLLEEPPGGSLLALVTSRAESLLDTVRSRCQELRLAPLSDEQVSLARADAPAHLTRLARGRPGRVDQLTAIDVDALLAALDAFLTGACSGPALGRALESVLAAATADGADEADARRLALELLHQRIHDLALQAAGDPAPGPTGELPQGGELPPIDRLFDMETAIMSGLTDLRRHLPAAVSLTALGTEFERARMGVGAAGKRYT